MTSKILNRRQARWSMFLSKFDFQLDYAPGKLNPADPASRRPDFEPQEGDDVLHNQFKALLTDYHTQQLFSHNSGTFDTFDTYSHINTLSTFTIDSSDLLKELKTALRADIQ
ncbi:hypothetical protein C0991_012232, partial [Blastosporella zonata]